jgi:hypothetical protein
MEPLKRRADIVALREPAGQGINVPIRAEVAFSLYNPQCIKAGHQSIKPAFLKCAKHNQFYPKITRPAHVVHTLPLINAFCTRRPSVHERLGIDNLAASDCYAQILCTWMIFMQSERKTPWCKRDKRRSSSALLYKQDSRSDAKVRSNESPGSLPATLKSSLTYQRFELIITSSYG